MGHRPGDSQSARSCSRILRSPALDVASLRVHACDGPDQAGWLRFSQSVGPPTRLTWVATSSHPSRPHSFSTSSRTSSLASPFNPCGGSVACPGTAILSRAGSWSMYPYSKVVMEAKIPCGGRQPRENRPGDCSRRVARGAEYGSLARETLFLSEYPRQPEVREGAVAAKPSDRGDLLALEGQDEHSVQSGDLGLGGWEVDAECWLGVGAGRYQ